MQVKSEQSNNVSQAQTSQPSILTPPTPVMEPSSFSIPSDSSSIRSRRSSSIRQSDCEKGGNLLNDQQLHATLHYHHHHHHHHHHHLHLQTSDASWDEDTSSTSGYRESYSMQLVSLEERKLLCWRLAREQHLNIPCSWFSRIKTKTRWYRLVMGIYIYI